MLSKITFVNDPFHLLQVGFMLKLLYTKLSWYFDFQKGSGCFLGLNSWEFDKESIEILKSILPGCQILEILKKTSFEFSPYVNLKFFRTLWETLIFLIYITYIYHEVAQSKLNVQGAIWQIAFSSIKFDLYLSLVQ